MMPARKGTRPPNAGKGRKPGSLNKATTTLKEAISHVVDSTRDDCLGWLRAVAEGQKEFEPELDDAGLPMQDAVGKPLGEWNWLRRPDPGMALKLWGDLSEFLQPKLARTEVAIDPKANKLMVTIKGL